MTLPVPGYDLAAWRRRVPLLASHIPMNHCSQGPQTDLTLGAAQRFLDSWNQSGMDWDGWMEEVRLAKQDFAGLINASIDEIAVFSSLSEASSAVASALDLSGRRSKVVVSEAEFPTVGHVWLAQQPRGAKVCWVPVRNGAIELASYDAAIDQTTAVVSACHGYYLNGSIQDLARLAERAHADGALLYADAYQTVGALPVDVKALKVDFLAAGNLKYLMGVAGIAFLYVRQELIDSLHPSVTGWFGRKEPFAFEVQRLDWSPAAARFDTGTPPIINAYIARAGMQMIASIGPEKIRAWHLVLAQRLIDGGRARGLTIHGLLDPARKTVSTAFVASDSHAVEATLRSRGILASARGPVIRLAPHFYNTIEDVDHSLDVLAEVMSGR